MSSPGILAGFAEEKQFLHSLTYPALRKSELCTMYTIKEIFHLQGSVLSEPKLKNLSSSFPTIFKFLSNFFQVSPAFLLWTSQSLLVKYFQVFQFYPPIYSNPRFGPDYRGCRFRPSVHFNTFTAGRFADLKKVLLLARRNKEAQLLSSLNKIQSSGNSYKHKTSYDQNIVYYFPP